MNGVFLQVQAANAGKPYKWSRRHARKENLADALAEVLSCFDCDSLLAIDLADGKVDQLTLTVTFDRPHPQTCLRQVWASVAAELGGFLDILPEESQPPSSAPENASQARPSV